MSRRTEECEREDRESRENARVKKKGNEIHEFMVKKNDFAEMRSSFEKCDFEAERTEVENLLN